MTGTKTGSSYSVNLIALLAALAVIVAIPAAAGASESAWEAMLRDDPGLAEDGTVGPLERQVLEVLTPEQAEAWLAGADPAGIFHPRLELDDRAPQPGLEVG